MNTFWKIGMCAAALLLSGCGVTGDIFGFDRSGPDEFTVVQNAPLSLPPNATLRPPKPGESRWNRNSESQRARSSLLTSSGNASSAPVAAVESSAAASLGEDALTNRAVAYYGSEPGIRRIVDEESARLAKEQENFLEFVVFWKDPEQPGTVLNAGEESRRLQENAALGKPVNSGEAPIIVRRKSGVSGLF